MFCHIYSEQAESRLAELREYVSNFPDSLLTPIHRKEIAYLEYLREHGADPGGNEAEKLFLSNT